MYLSYKWLKDYVDIPRSLKSEELGERLTMHTVEIDDILRESDKYEGILVGKIIDVKKHPDADKLQIAVVDVGEGEQEIVCGAPNIKPGQMVPVATVGTELPTGLKIEKAKIRGFESNGMLCAPDELGLGDDHSGIMILEEKTKIGAKFSDYLGLEDIIFDVDNKSITHRPDLWSHYGMAREISAFLGEKFKPLKENQKILKSRAPKVKLKAKIDDYKLCPRYMAVAMSGITVKESPKWLQDRLVAVGVRPINNIVDVTNYVMLELGQPMHAFDMDKISRGAKTKEIFIRVAKRGETMTTIDGEKRKLDEGMLLITDKDGPIAVAGVMGGEDSEVENDSQAIILESANFNFVSIRKTSAAFGLRTEASQRFEKSLDPNLCESALMRAVSLIREVSSGAKVDSVVADDSKFKLDQGPIEINLSWLSKFIGEEIEEKKIINILEKLGFSVKKGDNKLFVTLPTWRASGDISIKEDIAEEIVRIYGYDKLQPEMPKASIDVPEINEMGEFIRKIKYNLSQGAGMREAYNYSFVGEEQLKKLGIDFSSHLRLHNPISNNQTMMRQSLAPNLIENVKTNQARMDEFSIFEIGNVFWSLEGDFVKTSNSKDKLPHQEKRLGMAVVGNNSEVFENAKGVIKYLLDSLSIESSFENLEDAPCWADSSVCAQIFGDDKPIGTVSLLEYNPAKKSGIKKIVTLVDISMTELLAASQRTGGPGYSELPKYPPLIRDLAFVVNEKVLYNSIKEEILDFHEYISEAELFDIYRGEKIGAGNKNLAFRILYQTDRTLTGEEVDKIQAELIKKLEKRFEAKVRNF